MISRHRVLRVYEVAVDDYAGGDAVELSAYGRTVAFAESSQAQYMSETVHFTRSAVDALVKAIRSDGLIFS